MRAKAFLKIAVEWSGPRDEPSASKAEYAFQ